MFDTIIKRLLANLCHNASITYYSEWKHEFTVLERGHVSITVHEKGFDDDPVNVCEFDINMYAKMKKMVN